jgi:hypothetical protein
MPMTFDGSGTITGLAAGGLPDATITQADLAAGVAGTGPAFSAYVPNNTQSLTTATFTKIQFSTEEFDTNSNFDNATNYRFTPTVSGYYQVNLAIGFTASAIGICLISIFKNGNRFKDGSIISNSNSGPLCVASALIYFNGTTDYVEGFGYQTSGGNLTVSVNAGTAGYFQASLVRAA